ncbi:hypothetical protein FSP39_022115 [Pinctada imbricata]|uniref:Major facilitator superfamily (MFS) profile domain-containing protein n=1 Tax=Pinctada imbricata TaxID=66713 RepID=A0AA88YCE2_PINIB|nr:hypothetical protein FSP39_022115 [Pinctada imbricata]
MDPDTDVDDLLKALGTWGKFQRFQLLFNLFGIWPTAFHVLSTVFIYRPGFDCRIPDENIYNTTSLDTDVSYEIGQCNVKVMMNATNTTSESTLGCNGYSYAFPKDRSYVTEWDLVCDRSALGEFTQTLLMIGQAVGATVCTSLSDRFGRKTLNLSSHLCLFVVGIAMAFSPNYTVFAVLRFFMGLFQQGMAMSITVITLEIIPMEKRFLVEIFGLLIWTSGVAMITPFGYFLRHYSWRYTQLALTLVSSYSLIQYWIQEESIRWLLINNKLKEAERIVRKAARWNNVKYDDVIKEVEKMRAEKILMENNVGNDGSQEESFIQNNSNNDSQSKPFHEQDSMNKNGTGKIGYEVEHLNATHIFREKRILINSLILWFTWITNSLTYFALTLTSTSLAGNRFLNYLLMCLVEYPAALVEFLCLNRIGRKKTCIMFHVICGLSLATATFANYYSDGNDSLVTTSRVFTFVGKMSITGSFSTIFLYTPELYPTNLRNVGIGFSSAASRAGGMVSPFAATLAMYVAWGPGAVFGSMCFIVSFLCLYLPETRGHELPQTIEELKQWYKQHSGRGNRKAAKETL